MRSRQDYEALLSNPNVQRGLAVIRATEGTARYRDPYSVTFGGGRFDNSSGHPGTLYSFTTNSGKNQKTSATGAYQFLNKTWKSVSNRLGLSNMSPRNQDVAALALIDGRGGLGKLVRGDLRGFIKAVGPEWASLPTAPSEYDQPTRSWNFVEGVWNGGTPAQAMAAMNDFPVPEAAPRDPMAYASIAEPGLLGDPLVPSPSGAIQREMLAGLPGALPPAPVPQVQTASLGPINALAPLNPAPAGNVSRAPLQNLPERAGSAPQTPVERGLLANLPDPLNAAPVGTVERGGMLRDAAYGGDPSLMNAGGFVSPLARDDGSVYFGGEPMAGMAEEFPFVPTGQAGPDGDMQIMIGRNGIGETFPAPMDRTYHPVTAPQEGERPTLDLYDAQTRPVPMIAQAGSIVDQQTADPVGPVERGLLGDITAPAGIDAMTTASQNAMMGMPNLDPSQPLDYRGIPVPAQRPPAPLPAPQNIAQYNVASVEPNTPNMSVPGGFDVWQVRSPYGQATDSSTLSRNNDGTVSRYSEQYDRWDTYNPRTGSWTPGGGPSQTSDINLPSRDRLVDAGKRAGAGAAGGLLGSALLGPIGGLLGATLAKQVIGGEGLLSGGGKRVTNAYPSAPIGVARPNTQSEQQRIAATFGYSGATPGGGDPMSRNYAPAAYDSIQQGKTVGLF